MSKPEICMDRFGGCGGGKKITPDKQDSVPMCFFPTYLHQKTETSLCICPYQYFLPILSYAEPWKNDCVFTVVVCLAASTAFLWSKAMDFCHKHKLSQQILKATKKGVKWKIKYKSSQIWRQSEDICSVLCWSEKRLCRQMTLAGFLLCNSQFCFPFFHLSVEASWSFFWLLMAIYRRFQDDLLKKNTFPNAALMLSLKHNEATAGLRARWKRCIFYHLLGNCMALHGSCSSVLIAQVRHG